MDGFLRRLGIYGYDDIEDFVLAGLVTGDPVLLVGTHGTAKTMMCERLAKAMGLKFIAYDASKALFEDVLGFPDPYSIKEKKIEYVATDLSIDGKEFVLIDEISRANYQMQNKWLEIIRSRRIMGKTLDSLKYVFAAMNPPGYPGTKTLDPALSGRFGFIVWLPHFGSLKEEDKNLVISNLGDDDARMLKRRVEEKIDYEGIKVELSSFLEDVRSRIYPEIETKLRAPIERFIQAFAAAQAEEEEEMPIDGRRAGMMKRGLVAVLAIKAGKGKFSEDRLPEYAREITPKLVPFSVEKEDFSGDDFEAFLDRVVETWIGTVPFSTEKEVLEPLKLFTKMESAIESEPSLRKRLFLLERLYSTFSKAKPGSATDRRLVDFHESVFAHDLYKEGFRFWNDLFGEIQREGHAVITKVEAEAGRLAYFMAKGAPFWQTYQSLLEMLIKGTERRNQ